VERILFNLHLTMKLQPVLYWPVSYYTFIEWILDLCNICVCVCVCVLYNSPSTLWIPKGWVWQLTFIFILPLCSTLPAPMISSSLIWTNYKGSYYKIFSIFLLLCAFYIHIFLSTHFPDTSNFPQDETLDFISLQNRSKITVLWPMFST